ncbi:uncharacterized protein LOC144746786 [Ciona intestinalis]
MTYLFTGDSNATGRSNIEMEAQEHGYCEIAERSAYQNEQVTSNITQSTNYENLKNNVDVTRDAQGYADLQSVGPSVATTSNDGYEVFIRRNDENTAVNQKKTKVNMNTFVNLSLDSFKRQLYILVC